MLQMYLTGTLLVLYQSHRSNIPMGIIIKQMNQ